MNNYFDLPNPESLVCEVKRLTTHHSALVVRVSDKLHSQEICTITFAHPYYVRCPTKWIGAGFRKGEHNDFKRAFAHRINGAWMAQEYAKEGILFVANERTAVSRAEVIYIICGYTRISRVTDKSYG